MKARRKEEEVIWNKKFGNKLKRLIHIKGSSQTKLAIEMDISDVMLSRYITGKCMPSPYRITQIAKILDCDITCLYDVDN